MIRLAGPSTFKFTTIEQIYPFELGPNGETCYAKRLDCGSGLSSSVNAGQKDVPHGLSNHQKIISVRGWISTAADHNPIPFTHPSYNSQILLGFNATNAVLYTQTTAFASGTIYLDLIYYK